LINAIGTTYQVRTLEAGTYMLERVDITRLGDEPDPITGDVLAAPAPVDVAVAQDTGAVIDLLMLYTPAARAQRGGTAQIEALASQIVSDTNTAFARSAILPRIRLVGVRELPLVEASHMAADLLALGSSATARELRDSLRADLVQLLVHSPDQSACGVGYLLTSLGAASFDAYSLADVTCAAQYTPTHEIGHNLGSHHAAEDGAAGALFPYSYAFKDPTRGFRTIMAYSCTAGSCGRIPNFSNPNVAHNGAPTGSVQQNNALSINNAAFAVANFRQSAPSTSTPPAAPTGLQSSVTGNSVTVRWNAVSSDVASQHAAAESYVLQAGTSAGASNVFNAPVGNRTSATGVLPAGAYFWRVIAVNSAGLSSPSAEAQFSVGACAPPASPTNLTFSVSAQTVTLRWSVPAPGAADTFVVEAGSAPALANLAILPVGPTASLVTTAPSGAYYVRVRAQNACGLSTPSNEQLVVVP
jgi:hypothetical protein